MRPFVLEAKVSPLGCSRPLQRAIVDFAAAEIESAHRYVAQQRWWRAEHAESMLALRINRINGDWDAYWKALAQPSPAVANDNNPQKSLPRSA